jgi:hypothetical protein
LNLKDCYVVKALSSVPKKLPPKYLTFAAYTFFLNSTFTQISQDMYNPPHDGSFRDGKSTYS